MAITWLDPVVTISPTTIGSWVDNDVSADVPAGATGVIVEVDNSGGTQRDYGLRKNGSTDNRTANINKNGHAWVMIGVDSNRIFENYIAHLDVNMYLHGYLTSDASFDTNATQFSPTLNGWNDVDISTATGGDTAIAACMEYNSSGNNSLGARKNGSIDDRTGNARHTFFLMGVDANEILEVNMAVDTLFLNGWITKDAVFNTNGTDMSLGTTSSWINLSALPSAATGAFVEVFEASGGAFSYGLRKDGQTSPSIFRQISARRAWGFLEASSQIIEGRISSSKVDFYENGHSKAAAAAADNPMIRPFIM